MESEIRIVNRNLVKLARDIELIKNILLSEGQLTLWAKKELAEARSTNEEYFVLESVKKQILAR